jgi:hypothetical protein
MVLLLWLEGAATPCRPILGRSCRLTHQAKPEFISLKFPFCDFLTSL